MIRLPKFSTAALVAGFFAAGITASGAALAAPITFNFMATVDSPFGSEFSNGQMVTGSFTYESTTAPTGASNSDFAVYNALSNFEFSINSASGYQASSSAAPEVQVDDFADPFAFNSDRFAVTSRVSQGLAGNTPDVAGFTLSSAGIALFDPSDAVFSDALILPTSLDLADFSTSFFLLLFADSAQNFVPVTASLTKLEKVDVPEPAAGALAMLGLIAMAGLRRRQRRAQETST